MHAPRARSLYVWLVAAALLSWTAPAFAAGSTIKIAFWNVKSGKGQIALPGHPALFADTTNCTPNTTPTNAWGIGQVQAELQNTLSDPSVVALGVAEAWFCATPESIRAVLGWKAKTSNQNGVALVARYGFAGPEQWLQLDTSLNDSPADTMWVLRIPVCLDAYCLQSIPVYVTHWLGSGPTPGAEFDIQAQQTVQFLQGTSDGLPHVLIGDLNVFEGTSVVCDQSPNNTSLTFLRNAGYFDAWNSLRPGQDGTTGMLNRAGCGTPVGASWKRIDYVWSRSSFAPVDVQRFAMVPPGDAAPSDHHGIIATFPNPYDAAPAPAPSPDPSPAPAPSTGAGDIVLYARRAAPIVGAWSVVADATAAGGARIANPDAGAAKIAAPLAIPTSYFEMPFAPAAGVPYRLWIRGRAQNDYWANDSVYVQFSGSVTSTGTPIFRIGTTNATTVNLEDDANIGVSGWGWQDNGYGVNVLGTPIYFDGNPQTLRVQVREDGFSIDQIVLSPVTYLTASPGKTKNDTVILAESGGGTVVPPPPAGWARTANVTTTSSTVTKTSGCDGCNDAGVLGATALSSGDAYFQFTPGLGGRFLVGLLPDGAAMTDFKSMRYSVGFWADGTWDARELYAYKTGGTATSGDVFTVALVGGEARVYVNGVLAYRSPRAAGTYRIAAVFLSKASTMGIASEDLVAGTFVR